MPAFRQRPLSWLFVIATTCLDLVAAADREARWVDALVVGQIVVVSAWLVLGRSHRLARAGIFVALLGLLAVPDFTLAKRDSEHSFAIGPYVLGSIAAIAIVTTALVAVWRVLARAAFGTEIEQRGKRWRFSVAEILGWMTIVAIATVGLQAAHFAHLADNWRETRLGVAFLVAISGVVALSLGDFRKADWPKGIVESAWLIMFVVALFLPTHDPNVILGVCLFVGLWTLTQKLDDQPRATTGHAHAIG